MFCQISVLSSVSCLPFSAVFTAEQYQQHQEQLALMQKQQLEQSRQQQTTTNNNNTTTTATTTTANTQVSLNEWTDNLKKQLNAIPPPLDQFQFGGRSAEVKCMLFHTFSFLYGTGSHLDYCAQDIGPGQRSVCCFSPRHNGPAAWF